MHYSSYSTDWNTTQSCVKIQSLLHFLFSLNQEECGDLQALSLNYSITYKDKNEERSYYVSIQSEMKAESTLSLKILLISNYWKRLAICPVSV